MPLTTGDSVRRWLDGTQGSVRGRSGTTLTDVLFCTLLLGIGLVIAVASTQRLRADARRVACQANLRALSLASHAYAADENEQLLHRRQASKERWYGNSKWRTLAGLSLEGRPLRFPAHMLCPDRPMEAQGNIIRTYAQNWTGVRPVSEPEGAAVYIHLGSVKNPSAKVHLVDANWWEVTWRSAEYERLWKVHGEKQRPEGGAFVVAYRHGEAANVIRFDGSSHLYAPDELFPLRADGKPQRPKINASWQLYGPAK